MAKPEEKPKRKRLKVKAPGATAQEREDTREEGEDAARRGRQWQNRIVGYGDEDPEQLLANPKNWRLHPDTQAKALEGVLHEVGVVQNIIVNKRTGMLVDGHLRVMLALRRHQRSIPVTFVDLSEEEEAKVLATLDPISALAGTDQVQLEQLLGDISTDSPGLQSLLDSLHEEVEDAKGSGHHGEAATERYQGIYALRDDALFATTHPDNIWNLPELRRTRGELLGLGDASDDPTPLLAQPEDIPVDVWGGNGFPLRSDLLYMYGMHKWDDRAEGGMLGFYVYDDKFEVVWRDAVRWAAKWAGFFPTMIAPDFSLWRDDPVAVQIWNLYRACWCARYWQEMGIRVVPNLAYCDDRTVEWVRWVIPEKAPVVAIQCRATRDEYGKNLFRRTFATQVEIIQPAHVMLYGGEENRKWVEGLLPAGPEYHWYASWSSKRLSRRRREGKNPATAQAAAEREALLASQSSLSELTRDSGA